MRFFSGVVSSSSSPFLASHEAHSCRPVRRIFGCALPHPPCLGAGAPLGLKPASASSGGSASQMSLGLLSFQIISNLRFGSRDLSATRSSSDCLVLRSALQDEEASYQARDGLTSVALILPQLWHTVSRIFLTFVMNP